MTQPTPPPPGRGEAPDAAAPPASAPSPGPTPPPVPPLPAGALDAQGRLAAEVRCVECGYLLRGLAPTGECPECGAAVGASAQRWSLAHRRAEVLRSSALLMRVIALCCVALVGSVVMIVLFESVGLAALGGLLVVVSVLVLWLSLVCLLPPLPAPGGLAWVCKWVAIGALPTAVVVLFAAVSFTDVMEDSSSPGWLVVLAWALVFPLASPAVTVGAVCWVLRAFVLTFSWRGLARACLVLGLAAFGASGMLAAAVVVFFAEPDGWGFDAVPMVAGGMLLLSTVLAFGAFVGSIVLLGFVWRAIDRLGVTKRAGSTRLFHSGTLVG